MDIWIKKSGLKFIHSKVFSSEQIYLNCIEEVFFYLSILDVYLSIYLLTYLSIYPSTFLSIYLSNRVFIYLELSTYLFINLFNVLSCVLTIQVRYNYQIINLIILIYNFQIINNIFGHKNWMCEQTFSD